MATSSPTGWVGHVCRMLERTIIAAFTTRNTIPFLSALLLGLLIWKLPEADIKDLILQVIKSPIFAALGWSLFAITFYGAWRIFRWQEKRHDAEIQRLNRVKELALKGQLELPLDKP